MKKLLFMVAAVLVMVSCGSKEKELTPEQYASEFVDGVVSGDKAKVESVVTDVVKRAKDLGEEDGKTFVNAFMEKVDDLTMELTDEQNEQGEDFLQSNSELLIPLFVLGL